MRASLGREVRVDVPSEKPTGLGQVRLTRSFAVTSALGIAVVAVLLGYLYREVAIRELVAHEEVANIQLAQLYANVLWDAHGPVVAAATALSAEQITSDLRFAVIQDDIRTFSQGSRVLKVKMFDVTGRVVFSTNLDDVGGERGERPGYQGAVAGRPVSELVLKDEMSTLDGVIVERHLVESYVAIRTADGQVDGVLELYSDVTPIVERISGVQWRIGVIVMVTLVVLYLFLLAIVRRAEHAIVFEREGRDAAEERIRDLAYRDSLTGLGNRLAFSDHIADVLSGKAGAGESTALLFVDLDRFKVINDSLGHSAGDRLLKVVARRVEEAVRAAGRTFRMGGDEFTVVLPKCSRLDVAEVVAQRILDALSVPISMDGGPVTVSGSIGISLCVQDDSVTTAERLLMAADMAMYEAKSAGRGAFRVYSDDMGHLADERLRVESRFTVALDKGEFELHYQPIRRSTDACIVGVEALIRWNDPERGLLPPGQFLPLLEESGCMILVGDWVLRTACRDCAEWHRLGFQTLAISVNISSTQFSDPGLVDAVRSALAESGIDARYLDLELTERLLVDNMVRAVDTLSGLKSLGVSISIDDFGAGYSSFSYLRSFDVDRLKIDQSFVRGIEAGDKDAHIVAALGELALRLGVSSVGEGVEDSTQMDFLKEHGFTELQGNLLGKPMPKHEVAAYLQAGRNTPKLNWLDQARRTTPPLAEGSTARTSQPSTGGNGSFAAPL